MPRIPEYNEQYRYAGRAGNLGGRLNPGDYGGTAGAIGASGRIAGQQWQQAGAALTKAADTAAVIYDDYNTTKAQQAVSGLQKNFLAWQSEMAKNKGEAGMDAGAQYEQWQKKQVAELTKGMNDFQRGRFNALAEVKAAGFRQWAADYGSEQGLVFRNAEDVAGIKASGEVLVANLTNPSIAEPAIDSICKNAESIANRKGLGEAARAQFIKDALSESITPAIAAQIDAEKLSTARTALLYYKDKIGTANALKLQARIQAKGRELEARNRAAQEMNFLNAFASDPLKGIAEISTPEGQAKYGMDAKTAMGLRGMLQTQWSFNKQVEKEQRDNYTTHAINGIYGVLTGDPQKNVAPDPAKAYQMLQDSSLDAVTKIEMGRKLEEGTFGKVRDPGAVNDMARRIVAGEITSDAPIDTMLALGKASVGDVAALKAMRKDMEGPLKDYGKRWDSLVNNAYARVQIAAGTPEAAIKEDRARSQGMKLIKEAYEKGGDEAVEKLFGGDMLMTVLNNNRTDLHDMVSHYVTVTKAGSPQDSKLHRPGESGAEYLSRRLGNALKQHPGKE